jgi:4-coumarate--CoA ligase
VLRKMQTTSIMCHEAFLPVLREALKLGSGEADESSSLRLVLDPRKIVVLSDNARLDTVSGKPIIESLVRQGTASPEVARKLLGGDRTA